MTPMQRPKVGSSRMDAALDAMRPMGFSPRLVRKCVKNLLKVYGNEGWVVIEEAAYTLLIDTLLEEPVAKQLEHEPQNPLLEGGSQSQAQAIDHEKQPEPLQQLIMSDKNVIVEDKKVISEKTRGNGIIRVRREEEIEEQDDRAQLGIDLARTPKSSEIVSLNNRAGKHCFGWINDDEDDDFLYLTPAKSVESLFMKKN